MVWVLVITEARFEVSDFLFTEAPLSGIEFLFTSTTPHYLLVTFWSQVNLA